MSLPLHGLGGMKMAKVMWAKQTSWRVKSQGLKILKVRVLTQRIMTMGKGRALKSEKGKAQKKPKPRRKP